MLIKGVNFHWSFGYMSRINDNYFETSDRPMRLRLCDHPDCGQAGLFRAPKSREALHQYYFFCLEHVRQYNQAWDYLGGLSSEEIEAYTRDATVWERPSWPLGQWGALERELRDKALRGIFGEAPSDKPREEAAPAMPLVEREALAVLELKPPVDFATIKRRYRALVKKHHPDMQRGNKKNEEKFKELSLAFATLRKIYVSETE